jgi:hypothetical protein
MLWPFEQDAEAQHAAKVEDHAAAVFAHLERWAAAVTEAGLDDRRGSHEWGPPGVAGRAARLD